MLEDELDAESGYKKHGVANKETSNSRNGKTKNTIISEYGELDIEVPRNRNGDFEPMIDKKHQKNVTGTSD